MAQNEMGDKPHQTLLHVIPQHLAINIEPLPKTKFLQEHEGNRHVHACTQKMSGSQPEFILR